MGIVRLEGEFTPVEIRVYSNLTGRIHSEYTAIVKDEKNRIIAIGKDALTYVDQLESKEKEGISVYSTFKRNVVAEFEDSVEVVKYIFKDILTGIKSKFFRPTVAVCIPFELTGVEAKAFYELFMTVGAKEVTLLPHEFSENVNELAEKYSIVVGIIPN